MVENDENNFINALSVSDVHSALDRLCNLLPDTAEQAFSYNNLFMRPAAEVPTGRPGPDDLHNVGRPASG